jgi:hypothetical protein
MQMGYSALQTGNERSERLGGEAMAPHGGNLTIAKACVAAP